MTHNKRGEIFTFLHYFLGNFDAN